MIFFVNNKFINLNNYYLTPITFNISSFNLFKNIYKIKLIKFYKNILIKYQIIFINIKLYIHYIIIYIHYFKH